MSTTPTREQIEAHMREQSNEFILGWLEFTKKFNSVSFEEVKKNDSDFSELAKSILAERGVEYND